MISIKYLPFLLSITLFTACGSKDKKATPDIPVNNTTVPAQPASAQPLPSNGSVSSPQAGLNPAHGQPGHRCDIAVGAPLNSQPAQVVPAAPANVTMPQRAVPAPAPTLNTTPVNTTSTAGLNPAHGQPGHRCDIAVGAPLNSKPSN